MTNTSSPLHLAESLTEYWSPRVIGELDDSYIKVAKVKGVLAWHAHEHEDELFFVLKGPFKIEMHSHTAVLNTGDMYIVPKGVLHNPIAEEECLIMLIEKKTTKHTGDIVNEKTRSLDEQMRAL